MDALDNRLVLSQRIYEFVREHAATFSEARFGLTTAADLLRDDEFSPEADEAPAGREETSIPAGP